MKIGGRTPGTEVPLPPEVLELILQHIDKRKPRLERQRDLCSCCVLSRSWYSVAVKHLYRSPHLTTRNFDLFSRTLCPPVSSHVRSVGLEEFVVNLDMGSLAYESTKSLTARLLRRTRASLESFVAPSISFSLVGLTPLSKAENLRYLDLSNDFYDIDLSQLLRAVCDLTYLTFLSLPKAALKRAYVSPRTPHLWPPNLLHLRLNGTMPTSVNEWNGVVLDLPTSLHILTISFLNSPGHAVPDVFWYLESSAKQVTSLHILHATYRSLRTVALFKPFPNLRSISLPYDCAGLEEICTLSDQGVLSATLETLALTDDPYVCTEELNPVDNALSVKDLGLLASPFPSLRRLEVPDKYYSVLPWGSDAVAMERLQQSFAERWSSAPPTEVGVFLGDLRANDEPPWIK